MFQLMKMQSATLDETRSFLSQMDWGFDGAQTDVWFDYFNYNINYDIVCWRPNKYDAQSTIYLYTKEGKPNIVIFQTSSSCFNTLLVEEGKKHKGKSYVDNNLLGTIYRNDKICIEFREYKNEYSRRQYSIIVYNSRALDAEIAGQKAIAEAEIEAQRVKQNENQRLLNQADSFFYVGAYESAISKYELSRYYSDDDSYANDRINSCKSKRADQLVQEGDAYANSGNYSSAISKFNDALRYSPANTGIIKKKNAANKKLNEQIVGQELLRADSLYDRQQFALARVSYSKALAIEPSNIRASEQIVKIDNILTVLRDRKTKVYSYKALRPDNYSSFRSSLIYSVDSLSSDQREGAYRFTYNIEFDTSGINKSNYSITNSTGVKLSGVLEKAKASGLLGPSSLEGYNVASRESFAIEYSWSSANSVYHRKLKKTRHSNKLSANADMIIKNYIDNQFFKYGKYEFQVRTKTFNGNSFNNISLIKYKVRGPGNSLYSLLIPGLGSHRVTYGRKGVGVFAGFTCFTAAAIYYRYVSNQFYNSYLSAVTQTEIDSYYKKANDAHHIALALGTVSVSLYLYDFFRSFGIGCRNLSKTKFLRQQLRRGPVVIQSQTFDFK
jgi:tetratricopeptide (TPR) repeat protein